MHPWISGRASRIDALERVIRTIRREPGVRWATRMQVAEWAIETGQNAHVKAPLPEQQG
jgi:hypothetical protein